MNFNKQQTLAIEKRGGKIKNILVSAGAGSGKTAVLTQRVINLICNTELDINIDNLLIMTFTKNAAAEMRERIASKLRAKISQLSLNGTSDPNELIKIKNQLSLLSRANITTIDSFCNNVLRQYFYKINIDPNYRIAGSDNCQELSALSSNVMDSLFEAKLEEKNSDFILLMDYFCQGSVKDTKLREILTELNNLLSSVPYPEKWLDEALSVYEINDNSISPQMLNVFLRYAKYIYSCGIAEIKKASAKINDIAKKYYPDTGISANPKLLAYLDTFAFIEALLEKIKSCNSYEALYLIFNTDLPALSRCKNPTPQIDCDFEDLKNIKNNFAKSIWNNAKNNVFQYDKTQLAQIISHQYYIIKALFNLYREYTKLYSDKKNELAILSFADVNHYCIQILLNEDGTPTQEALEYRNKFAEVIVDEYQDNNTLQEYLLNAITCEKNNLFMVGDIKQSIYKFRHACPEIFAHKYNTYSSNDLSEGNICISLNTNYRSKKTVLDMVNLIFYQLMQSNFGGINYGKDDALGCGTVLPAAINEIQSMLCNENEIIICDKKIGLNIEDKNDEIEALENDEIEAHIVAKKISELVNPQKPTYIFDSVKNKYRPCKLSDITILMRSANKSGYTFSYILNKYGIPTISKSSYSLFNELEIKTIMAILKVLDNPYQDKELILVLHSPIFNVECSELAQIRLVDTKAPMYDNILKYIEINNDDISKKLCKFKAFCDKIWELNSAKPFCEVLDNIYRITDYINYVGIIRNGNIRIENLKILSNIAQEIFNSGTTDFGGIVNKLCDIEKKNPEYESTAMPEYENAVQILSIHKSKGLEFPIVILTQAAKSLSKMGVKSDLILDANMGISFKYFDIKNRVLSRSPYRTAAAKLKDIESLEEELRILYVALTRAKEKLIVTGVVQNYDKSLKLWQSYSNYSEEGLYLPTNGIIEADSYLNWIMMAVYRAEALNHQLNKLDIQPIDADRLFKISLYLPESIKNEDEDASRILKLYKSLYLQDFSKKEYEQVNSRLLYEYIDKTAAALPSKISISEIKRQHQLEAYEQLEYDISTLDASNNDKIINILTKNKKNDTTVKFEEPEFLSEAKTVLYGNERGTAYHTVFEHLIMDANSNLSDIKNQLNKLKEMHILSEAEYNSITPSKFINFLQSPIGRRVCSAQKVYRETPFVMSLSPKEIFVSQNYDETSAKILVHGIIDMYFEENGYLVLVDYKTDKVNAENTVEIISDRYKIQLDFYKKAIELSTGLKVKEMYLYLISIDSFVSIP